MRHRIFILLLAGALILAMALLRNAAQATPYSGGALFGGALPLWDLRAAIPFGIFAAGLFTALVGLSARVLLSVQLLCGRGYTPMTRTASRISAAALWCGWPFVLCCTNALLYIVPRYYIPHASATPNHLDTLRPLLTYQLYGFLGIMVLCRLLDSILPPTRPRGWAGLLILWLPIISTDILWLGGHGMTILTTGLSFAAVAMFSGNKGQKKLSLLPLLAAAACFVYGIQPRDSGGLFPTGAADYFFYAATLALIGVLSLLKMADLRHRAGSSCLDR